MHCKVNANNETWRTAREANLLVRTKTRVGWGPGCPGRERGS